MTVTTQRAPSRPVRQRPAPEMAFFRTHVRAVQRLNTYLARITLAGDDLTGFVSDGPDQRIKIFLPRDGQPDPVPLARPPADWYAIYRAMPLEIRPYIRTYTIRRHRPEVGEVDIDFVLHGEEGPGSRWAMRAQPGDPLLFYGPWADYEPTLGTDWQLIAGDETALPAIGAILESMPAGTRALVFVEVPDESARQWIETRGDVTLTWLYRDHAVPGTQPLLDALQAATFPVGRPYVWISGESSVVRSLRRHLVNDRGVARHDLYFAGYWRRGRTEDDAYAEYDARTARRS